MFLFAGKSKEEKGRKGEGMGKKFYPIGKYTPAMLLSVKNLVSKLLKLQNLQRSFQIYPVASKQISTLPNIAVALFCPW
jgi:hypothetical protein